MLEIMMKPGGYRVDYFNRPDVIMADRLAFYVRGELNNGSAYSIRARMHLLAGFQVIMSELGLQNLVAVYMDIADCDQLIRPAYDRMKDDLQTGLFRRLFVFHLADLAPCPAVMAELANLRSRIPGFEILAFDPGQRAVLRMETGPANSVANGLSQTSG